MPVDSQNVGVAFALVIGAGLATALGASVVFFPSLVKLASRRVLAGALGISAGVMTYVSFVEIFAKSQGSFKDSGYTEEDAYLYATLCFFGGVVCMLLVDVLVKLLSRGGGHGHSHDHEAGVEVPEDVTDSAAAAAAADRTAGDATEELGPGCVCCSEDPAGDLDKLQRQADHVAAGEFATRPPAEEVGEEVEVERGEGCGEAATTTMVDNDTMEEVDVNDPIKKPQPAATQQQTQEQRKLVKMGINTAVAIGLHNFPEGLATFVAALDDPRVGAVLAIAIGIHNIPEGLCVALPIYYATGNRCRAFMWALISGASEPIAALLGWAILANNFSDRMYAILFGLVAGMMVIISTRELLPTAHRYDPEDSVVTFSFIGGMIIMALSLVLFII
uniref:Zinc transporter ZupT n=1 Tax=Grammatophora oceanica TaxID=210454 RepID=A0A7S1Y9E3_9STRA|mmetsp:Transcript_34714/g.51570  ORF Transcript_34714/g.51570 Transcript_34714/m.51570 type:complete len:390 (+) Transcript_34714:168-1337(+)|eukprot:CAMPEP_0194027220 /NCGR_PEP_ID=MMETSP0009_2-20130614/1392_1 /TAXON_ID=210454 /ORGANISM="Grammatophora oceanica, Strain CCMP 410" /LENGTH=389 /DNA_ID=CAMNT_0038666195 /DNA_START=243 /DNA_END=1412 /DNA_ORIENTATION=-